MIGRATIARVKDLASQGFSRRKIGAILNISRQTVHRIIHDQHPSLREEDPHLGSMDDVLFSGPLGRCEKCGAKVYLPCLACRTREHVRREKIIHEEQ